MEKHAEYVTKPVISVNQIKQIMRDHGIKRSGMYSEYERGKSLIRSLDLTPEDYYQAVQVVAQWVGI